MQNAGMSLRTIFARNLRLARSQAGLSQDQLATLAGLNSNFVGRLEREQSSPTLETIEALARALNQDVIRFLSFNDP